MTAAHTAATVRDTRTFVSGLGGAFMVSPEAKAWSKELGLRGWPAYMAGRCGVLGEVDADVVAATAFFFPPGQVRDWWGQVRRLAAQDDRLALRHLGARYAGAVVDAWWRARYADWEPAVRAATLLGQVVDHADVVAAPLFAGWRALPLPSDPAAQVGRHLMALREHRGAMHGAAVLTTGLTPLAAILAGPGGETNARFFSWPEPYPPSDDATRAAYARADALTDTLVAPAYDVLDRDEAAELAVLLDAAARWLHE